MNQVFKSAIILSLALSPLLADAQQTDPTLTATVVTQELSLKKAYEKREKTQNKILAAQATISLAMERVHSVEKTILDYMSNASAATQNLYQIKRAAELVAIKIPHQLQELTKAVKENPKGAAITGVISKTTADVSSEMLSLYGFMNTLVTSTSYGFKDDEKNDDSSSDSEVVKKKRVNLLSAAERYYIASEVVGKLERINTKLFIITWQVKCYSWMDLWWRVDPKSYGMYFNGKAVADRLIRDWNRMSFKY